MWACGLPDSGISHLGAQPDTCSGDGCANRNSCAGCADGYIGQRDGSGREKADSDSGN